jgi:hypothetical protein
VASAHRSTVHGLACLVHFFLGREQQGRFADVLFLFTRLVFFRRRDYDLVPLANYNCRLVKDLDLDFLLVPCRLDSFVFLRRLDSFLFRRHLDHIHPRLDFFFRSRLVTRPVFFLFFSGMVSNLTGLAPNHYSHLDHVDSGVAVRFVLISLLHTPCSHSPFFWFIHCSHFPFIYTLVSKQHNFRSNPRASLFVMSA